MIEARVAYGLYQAWSASATSALAKRTHEDMGDGEGNLRMTSGLLLALLLTMVFFVPIFLYIGYTLEWLYPILAMIEDPSPPAYEPVPLNEDDALPTGDESATPVPTAPGASKTITSSLRAVNRLLYSVGGWRGNFRGFWVGFHYMLLTTLMSALVGAVVPSFFVLFSTLPISLALVQVSTAWLHAAIRGPNPADNRSWWRRGPPMRKTFEATCFPVLLNWAAVVASTNVLVWVGRVLGLPLWSPHRPLNMPQQPNFDPAAASWQSLVVFLIAVALEVLLVLPSRVALVRVQASLLPPEEDTIVPFDRSFQGKVQPAVVDGKGYVNMRHALATFDRASWIRLYVLYAKVFVVSLLAYLLMVALLVPELILLGGKKA